MKINSVNSYTIPFNKGAYFKNRVNITPAASGENYFPRFEYIKANYAPYLNFTGNAPKIVNAYKITDNSKDCAIFQNRDDGSYIVDENSKIIYGEDAVRYLKNNKYFEYDTQIILPKKCCGKIKTANSDFILPENSAILINAGSAANVDILKGYPMVLMSKKDPIWYERYSKNADDMNIQNKFKELIYYNSHLYNGDFSPNLFLPDKLKDEDFLSKLDIQKYESNNNLVYDLHKKRDLLPRKYQKAVDFAKGILDKLHDNHFVEQKQDGYLKCNFDCIGNEEILRLKDAGFKNAEISTLIKLLNQTNQAHKDAQMAFLADRENFTPELIKKMLSDGILYEKNNDIYWTELFENESGPRNTLEYRQEKITPEEADKIVEGWYKGNYAGFDLTGLKFIDNKMAIYNLNDKLNNWTCEKTNWITNSTAITSDKCQTPSMGVSMVQFNEPVPIKMSEIRKEEKLHCHPNTDSKKQSEIYIVSSGSAALNVVQNGKSQVKILNEGDLAIVEPGVMHCVNSILGEYEHIVTQLPSAFQYGFGFKSMVNPPDDYDEERLQNEAIQKLTEIQYQESEEVLQA